MCRKVNICPYAGKIRGIKAQIINSLQKRQRYNMLGRQQYTNMSFNKKPAINQIRGTSATSQFGNFRLRLKIIKQKAIILPVVPHEPNSVLSRLGKGIDGVRL
jgi:hypothetical protein